MTTLPGEFREALDRVSDRLGPFGQRILWYPDIGSTNDVAMALADAGEPEGTVVAADSQSAGRGRLGRSWASPPGAGIYASVVLRPAPHVAPLLTLTAGVAVAEGIEAATGLPARVKWPNDVFVEGPLDSLRSLGAGRKLAGILAESASLSAVVLGFGINVLPAAYPPEVALRATSIEAELGRASDRGLVLAECLAALGGRYRDLQAQRFEDILAAWRGRASSTFGRRVEWDAGGALHDGVAHDVDRDGALLVKQGQAVVRVIAGEVRWI
jgi:BirA family biotin operon repressor/biotin-[acetyl-CoA-carboxylase] ligase